MAARDNGSADPAGHLCIRADGAVGDIRFLRARDRRTIRLRIDVVIPHLCRRDGAAVVVRQRDGNCSRGRRAARRLCQRKPKRSGDGRALLHRAVLDAVRTFDRITRHERQHIAVLLLVDADRSRNADVRTALVLALLGGLPRDRHRAAPCTCKGGVLCADGEVLLRTCGRGGMFRQGDIRPRHLCRRCHLADVDRGAARQIKAERGLLLVKAEILDGIHRNGILRCQLVQRRFDHALQLVVNQGDQIAELGLGVLLYRAYLVNESALLAAVVAGRDCARRRNCVDDALLLCTHGQCLRLHSTRQRLLSRAVEIASTDRRTVRVPERGCGALLRLLQCLCRALLRRLRFLLLRCHVVVGNRRNARLCDVVERGGEADGAPCA